MSTSENLQAHCAGYRVTPLYAEFGSGDVTGYQFSWRDGTQRWSRPFSYDTEEDAWVMAYEHYHENRISEQGKLFEVSKNMVHKHVLKNVSVLVTEMNHHEEYQDKLSEVLVKDDFLNPAYEAGYTVSEREDGFYLFGDDGEAGAFYSEHDAWVAACEREGIEPYQNEAYEWWMVSNALEIKLVERGEMVIRFFGLIIWGRCDTGSLVYTDDVMVDIANNTDI